MVVAVGILMNGRDGVGDWVMGTAAAGKGGY